MENSSLSNGSPQGWMTTNPDSKAWSGYDSLPCCPCISHDHNISHLLFLSLSLVSPPPRLRALLSNSLGCHYSFKPVILTTLNSTSDGGRDFYADVKAFKKSPEKSRRVKLIKKVFYEYVLSRKKKERERKA